MPGSSRKVLRLPASERGDERKSKCQGVLPKYTSPPHCELPDIARGNCWGSKSSTLNIDKENLVLPIRDNRLEQRGNIINTLNMSYIS